MFSPFEGNRAPNKMGLKEFCMQSSYGAVEALARIWCCRRST